jgi:hypothetical protein
VAGTEPMLQPDQNEKKKMMSLIKFDMTRHQNVIIFMVNWLWHQRRYPVTWLIVGVICHYWNTDAAVNVNSVPPWSGVDANSTSNPEPNIFSPSIFWRTHSNYAPYIRRIPGYWLFSFLSNSCLLSARRIQNIGLQSPAQCTDNFI